MRHCWLKSVALAACVWTLAACQSALPVRMLDFQVDQQQVQSLPMNERGALPADDGVFKVERLGLMLLQNADSVGIDYAWNVMVNVSAQSVAQIQVEQVLSGGELRMLIQDTHVAKHQDSETWTRLGDGSQVRLLAKRWQSVSKPQSIAHAPWLLQSEQESMLVFKISLTTQEGNRHVLYQPMVVSMDAKNQYRKAIAKVSGK